MYEELKDICGEGRDIPNEYTSDVLALIEAYKMEKGSVDEWQGLAARRATRMTELMNEVDRLKAENEKLLARAAEHVRQFNELSDFRQKTVEGFDSKIAALEAENEALRKDAERYRWLRQPDNASTAEHMAWTSDSMDAFDAEVDAAIAREAI